jgi:hypothetical protein
MNFSMSASVIWGNGLPLQEDITNAMMKKNINKQVFILTPLSHIPTGIIRYQARSPATHDSPTMRIGMLLSRRIIALFVDEVYFAFAPGNLRGEFDADFAEFCIALRIGRIVSEAVARA